MAESNENIVEVEEKVQVIAWHTERNKTYSQIIVLDEGDAYLRSDVHTDAMTTRPIDKMEARNVMLNWGYTPEETQKITKIITFCPSFIGK